jgi:2-polyprenyl-3-methyl-5-hydroxy-6-metoxy-1,4-benzoquinol methylase
MFQSYEEQFELMERHIKALARGKAELSILEAGCGRKWPLKLDGVKYKLTGVDLDEKALAARQDLDEAIVADLRSVDLGGRRFDVVYNSYVLEHVQNAALVLENLYRWLKPGGLLILRFPDRNTAFGFAGRITPFWLHVAYCKYVLRRWNAGKPGFGPYPTHYDWIVSREGLRQFCAAHALRVDEEYGLCDFQLEKTVGTRLALVVSMLLSALSLGRLPWRHNNLTYVLTKASRSGADDALHADLDISDTSLA